MRVAIIFIAVFFNVGFAQNIDSLETISNNLKTEIRTLEDELETIKGENTQFTINGNITDVTADGSAIIWGSAIPVDLNTLIPGFTSRGFMVVLNPNKENTYLDMYVNGRHYYKGEEKRTKYFGDLPSKTKDIINLKEYKIKLLTNEITSINNDVFRLKGEESLRKAERLYTETKYSESLVELEIAKYFSVEGKIVNGLLYKNYVELIKESQAVKNYSNVFTFIDTAVELPGLSEEQYQHLKTVHSSLCIYLADSCYQNKLFDESITYYDNAEKYGFKLSTEEKERIANIYFNQAEEQLKLKNANKASMLYLDAVYYDKKLFKVIDEHLDSQKRSSFLYITLSVILPGMGLVAQGEEEGWACFSISTSAIIAAILFHQQIMQTPSSYLNNPGAGNPRDESTGYRNISLGVFAIAYIWGIISTENHVDEYNKKYNLSFNTNNNKLNFAMRINF
ncbi:MAG: hypothetical protein M0P61_00025 [Ignavibacteriaceae bacterium]|jgi:hypothetical protein|nr:hypothetical protein [Ignavibacteriaceae bacterium]